MRPGRGDGGLLPWSVAQQLASPGVRSLLNDPTDTGLKLSDEQLRVIQETVWEVVKSHPDAGLAAEG